MEEEFLTCSICFDVYKEPKTLSCLHRFCGMCLHNYIVTQRKSALQKLNGFPCPVCREVIKAPEPGKDPSEWTGLLKTDFHLTSLIRFVEEKRTASAKTPNVKYACDVHHDKELDLYCLDCEVTICHLCAGIKHRGCGDVVTLKEVASKKKIDIQKSLKAIERGIEETNLSREKTLDSFEKMKFHAEAQIKKCAGDWRYAIEKEERRLLDSLENYFKTVYEKITPKLVEFDRKISSFSGKVDIFRNKYDELSDYDVINMFPKGIDLNTFGLNSYKSIVTHLRQLNIRFEQATVLEINMGEMLLHTQESPTHSPSPKKLEITSERGSSMVYTIDNNESVLYSSDFSQKDNPFHGLGQPSTNYSLTKSLRNKLSKFIPSPFSQSGSSSSTSSSSSENKTLPHSSRIRSASRKDTHSCIPKVDADQETQRASTAHRPSAASTGKSLAQKIRTISTRFRDDTADPKLRDVIVIGQGGTTVMVTDWANQCVKAFYVRRDKDSRLEVAGKPWSITSLTDTSAAVSLPLSKQICILKTTPPLTMQKSFVAAKNYSGLATLNSEMLVASGGNDPPSVDIINLYGEILRSFSTSPDKVSPLFMFPSYVCVTPSMFILVSDKKQGAVICMSHTGEIKYKFQPKAPRNLQEPCGLCTTPSGHVMLLESRGLLQLGPGGEMDRPLIRSMDGLIKDPKGVALDSDGHVYVTTEEQNVAVFKLDL